MAEMSKTLRRQTNLSNESSEYLAGREELRLAEIALMRQREKVAELRRQLPGGPIVQDYVFEEGPANLDAGDAPLRPIRLSELFSKPDRPVVIYHFMYGKKQSKPCPMRKRRLPTACRRSSIWASHFSASMRTSTTSASTRTAQR